MACRRLGMLAKPVGNSVVMGPSCAARNQARPLTILMRPTTCGLAGLKLAFVKCAKWAGGPRDTGSRDVGSSRNRGALALGLRVFYVLGIRAAVRRVLGIRARAVCKFELE